MILAESRSDPVRGDPAPSASGCVSWILHEMAGRGGELGPVAERLMARPVKAPDSS